jgi:hypothetical protein
MRRRRMSRWAWLVLVWCAAFMPQIVPAVHADLGHPPIVDSAPTDGPLDHYWT